MFYTPVQSSGIQRLTADFPPLTSLDSTTNQNYGINNLFWTTWNPNSNTGCYGYIMWRDITTMSLYFLKNLQNPVLDEFNNLVSADLTWSEM